MKSQTPRRILFLLFLVFVAAQWGCDDGQSQTNADTVGPDTQDTTGDNTETTEPGTTVQLSLPLAQQQELDRLNAEVAAAQQLTTDEFLTQNALGQSNGVSYVPSDAAGMSLIQASSLNLDADELVALDQNGFVISEKQRFPTFVYGYSSIYADDLPLFISADSILYAVHRSYDDMLKSIEQVALMTELRAVLDGMRKNLADGEASWLGSETEADVDLFLAVTLSLLDAQQAAPVAGADPAKIGELFDLATAAEGATSLELFGVARDMDFSQFTPRGHYTDTPELERYFKSMMWLGRIDLRLLETQPDLSQVFHRRQFDSMLAFLVLSDATTLGHWTTLDNTIRGFVGESDNMTLPQVQSLLDDLGVASAADTQSLADGVIAQAIVDGGYGTQKISSHIMINGVGAGTMPLSSTFLVLGQRYVVDSHVFSNVVYDRVNHGATMRMMPDPLDVAYAALANDQAASLLEGELRTYDYQGDLGAMRLLVDAHGQDFWQANLYNLWLGSLRALSPDAASVADPAAAGLPEIASSEQWGRRLLNAQLASWAELRHDTILYAKQSYSSGTSCEFPDAYVEPYPEFFAALVDYSLHGREIVAGLDMSSAQPYLAEQIDAYFVTLYEVSSMLQEMAQYERDGTPFTDTHMAFINETVRLQPGCGSPVGAEGWYARLFFSPWTSVEFEPTIADVHTQPTDEGGNMVGNVLHVGTGMSRLMVVTANTCNGPRAYVGLASSYFETITSNFDRLDDIRWTEQLYQSTPDDVEWMQDLVVR